MKKASRLRPAWATSESGCNDRGGGGSNYSKVVTSDDIETDVYTQKQAEFRLLTYVIELCTVAEHEIHVGHKLIR